MEETISVYYIVVGGGKGTMLSTSSDRDVKPLNFKIDKMLPNFFISTYYIHIFFGQCTQLQYNNIQFLPNKKKKIQ